MSVAIQVENLGKRYHVAGAGAGAGYRTLRETLNSAAASMFRRKSAGQSDRSEFWALRDVSFTVRPGEIIGIVGRNGAGKSTLLKILSRITRPTTGHATLRGRVGSLLEVGTGFHPELSGRENIYLSGVLLGMSRDEIDRKFDQIVAFAEVERFLDTPVKRYSSGMYVRLAFAVAAHLESEILLVDEVLAVGDAAFQRKCLGKMDDVASQGRTIFFVSHNMAAVTRLCQRAIWLEGGRVRAIGPVERIVSEYLASGTADSGELRFDGTDAEAAPGSEYIQLRAVRVRNESGEVSANLDIRQSFSIEVEHEILRPVSGLRLGVRVSTYEGTPLFTSTDHDNAPEGASREPGRYVQACRVPGNFLNAGQYFVTVGADFPMVRTHFLVDPALTFRIEQTGGVGGSIPDARAGLLRVQLPWITERAGEAIVSDQLASSDV